MCSGSSITTPGAHTAAFRPTSRRRAGRRTCRRRESTAAKQMRAQQSPCSPTSSSRLPNSTPCRAHFVVRAAAACGWLSSAVVWPPSSTPCVSSAVGQRRAVGRLGRASRTDPAGTARMSVRIHSSSLLARAAAALRNAAQAWRRMLASQAGSPRGRRNASNASRVKPGWSWHAVMIDSVRSRITVVREALDGTMARSR